MLSAMQPNVTAIERAFQLASRGESLTLIRKQLKEEGYDLLQIEGRQMFRQLSDIIEKANQSNAQRP